LSWQQLAGEIIFAALVLLAVAVFLVGLWLVYRLIVLVVTLPARLTRGNLAIAVFVLVALVLNPPVLSYLATVLTGFAAVLPDAILSFFGAARVVAGQCGTECSIDTLSVFGTAIADFMKRILIALRLEQFPVRGLAVFLLVFAILYFAYDRVWLVHRARAEAQGTRVVVSPSALVHIAFFVLVLFSFYLCLSALLAIPLLQSKSATERFGVADLDKEILADLPEEKEYDARFPKELANFPKLNDTVAEFGENRAVVVDRLAANQVSLTELWGTVRNGVFIRVAGFRARAVQNFNVNAARLGDRERTDSYAEIYNWYQSEREQTEQSLNDCRGAINNWIRNAGSLIEGWRTAQGQKAVANSLQSAVSSDPDGSYVAFLTLQGNFDIASDKCDRAQNASTDPLPPRLQRGSSLGAIGKWTIWLLDTDSIPLVIIIGLVGFSLLGATISRVVRAGTGDGFRGLSITDLLVVVAGGTTAAMVVFLASYGGLSIVGDARTDPDPYVVFIACLLAAVFSEDVWVAFRARFQQQLQAVNGGNQADRLNDGGGPDTSPAPAGSPDAAPTPDTATPVGDQPPGGESTSAAEDRTPPPP
jgi:hypothetical protein